MKLTKTENKILEALNSNNHFYGDGKRNSTAVRKLIEKGLVKKEDVKITSSYAAPQRYGASGTTLLEVSIYC